MHLTDVMDQLGDQLATIDDVNVSPYWADRIIPPAAVVGWPTVEFDSTMARGADTYRDLPVHILVGKVNAESSRDELARYLRSAAPQPAITYIGAGAAAVGQNEDLTPELPPGWAPGQLLVCVAATRDRTVGPPTIDGWTLLEDSPATNLVLYATDAAADQTAPLVEMPNGAAGATTIAQIAAFAGTAPAASVRTHSSQQSFVAAQNLPWAALSGHAATATLILAGFKADQWTSVAAISSNYHRIGAPTSELGDDAGVVWDYRHQAPQLIGGSWQVTGGAAAVSEAITVALAPATSVVNRSIKAVLEAATYTGFRLRVTRAEPTVMTVAGAEYLAATFFLDIIGPGD